MNPAAVLRTCLKKVAFGERPEARKLSSRLHRSAIFTFGPVPSKSSENCRNLTSKVVPKHPKWSFEGMQTRSQQIQSSHSLRSNLTFPRVPQRPCPQGPGGHPPIPLPLAFLPISFIFPLIPPIPPCPPTLGDLIPVPPISPFKGLMTLGSDLVTVPPL